jgi:xylose dehydrogenase (NAD/NADP)
MADTVRYGVLSTAQIAVNRHVPSARAASNSEIVAISSRDQTKAEQSAAELGIGKAYGSYQALLDDPDIDAVINPLPNGMHCEWTIKAAQAGKHILCEKPLAVTVAECRQMIDAAKANGVLLVEAFTHRLNPQLQCARRLVQQGEIGEVKLARAELTFSIRDWENDVRVKPELGGGALLDAGCYCISAVRFALNAEPVAAQAFQHVRNGVDATMTGLLRFAGDHVAYIATGMEEPFRCLLEVVGSQGVITVLNMFDEEADVHIAIGNDERVEKFSGPDRFQVQFERFSNCILQGKAPEFPPEDGLKNVAVLQALKQAADTGSLVEVQP